MIVTDIQLDCSMVGIDWSFKRVSVKKKHTTLPRIPNTLSLMTY